VYDDSNCNLRSAADGLVDIEAGDYLLVPYIIRACLVVIVSFLIYHGTEWSRLLCRFVRNLTIFCCCCWAHNQSARFPVGRVRGLFCTIPRGVSDDARTHLLCSTVGDRRLHTGLWGKSNLGKIVMVSSFVRSEVKYLSSTWSS
jgi:hypothetical protein